MNEAIFSQLISEYNSLAFTHHYMFGFVSDNSVFCAVTTSEILAKVCTLDIASRGCGYSLRYKPNIAQKQILKSCEIFSVCDYGTFTEMFENSIYNRGEIFEKLVTEHFGQVWKKDNVPFIQAGDIVVNGIHYQIKFEKATFINEKSLQRMRAVA